MGRHDGSGSDYGFVSIVGAGPWDPELLTLAGKRRLERADVVIADYLANPALLMHCPTHTQIYQRTAGPRGYRPATEGPLPQAELNRLMVEHAQAGRYVVRLKGGDPCMFGRGGEEAEHLADHGVPFEMIPGVSSPIAAPEAAGIPVTHRNFTPAVTFVSGYEAYQKAGLQVAWEHLAKSAGTLVLMMSVKNARDNAQRLIDAGRDPATPTAIVRWGTRGIQRTVVGRLETIADRMEAAGIRPPAVMVVGEVVGLRAQLAWRERRPLFGRRVVVTRAPEQAQDLLLALSERGADAVAFPCLQVAAPTDLDSFHAAVARVVDHDGVIVSSPNGVRALMDALDANTLDVRALAGRCVVAIGTGTARACQARGLRPDLIPERARAEGLVDLLRDEGLLTKRWLHIRAKQGRDLLGKAITAAGGTYTLAIGYCTIRPAVPQRLLYSLQAPADGGEGFDAVCFASGKTARHFLATLSEGLGEATARARLSAAKIVALGPVTAAAIEALGLQVDAIAEAPTDTAMADAVQAVLPAQRQDPNLE